MQASKDPHLQNDDPSLHEKKLKPSIFKKLGISHPILEYRTPFEKSDFSCIENILRDSIRSFGMAYGGKAAFSLLAALWNFKKLTKNPILLLKALFNIDNLKLGSFMGSLTALLKTIIALGRIFRKKDDGWNALAAGFIGGYLSFFFFNKSNRIFLGCFMLSRAFDTYYNHLVNSGVIKRSPYHYALVFALMNMLTGYSYAHEPYLSNPGFIKFGDQMTSQSRNEYILLHLRREGTRRRLVKSGFIKEPYLLE